MGGSAWSKTKSCTCSSLIGKRKRKMQYLLKQSEMENKEKKQKEQKGENPSIDQNCNSERGKGVGLCGGGGSKRVGKTEYS